MKRKNGYRKSHRKRPLKPLHKKRFFWPTIFAIIIFFSISYLIAFFDFFWVRNIEISGNREVSKEDLEEFIDKNTTKKILFLESKSMFLLNPASISEKIINEFPALSGLVLRRKYPDEITLRIEEKKSIGTFCAEECFIINSNGVIFKKAEKRMPLNIKGGEGNYTLGEQAISRNEMRSIIKVWNKLAGIVAINEFETDGFYLNVITKEKWRIIFNLDEDIPFQAIKLLSVLGEKISLERRKSLEYIDLRFNGKVYFK